MNILPIALAVPTLFLIDRPASDENDGPELNTLAAEARAEAKVPGLGLVVVRKGEELRIAVDGVRVAGNETKLTAEDKWHLGSISKSFTATLVARMVKKELVAWDDTIEKHLGELIPEIHEDHRETTFRHLLSHRSGLKPNIPMAHFAKFGQEPEDEIEDRLDWVRIALERKPAGKRGEHFEYSNDGYIVAGAMLEAATGESWELLMESEVFDPLKLASAGFGPPRGETELDQPRGHQPARGEGEEGDMPAPLDADNPAALGPAGRIHMSLADLACYLAVHAEKRESFLPVASYDILHTPPFGGTYAMGWLEMGTARWHNGSNTMWYAEAAFDPKSGTVAAVAVNDGDLAQVKAPVSALLKKLLE